jgi:hypothetical protein
VYVMGHHSTLHILNEPDCSGCGVVVFGLLEHQGTLQFQE